MSELVGSFALQITAAMTTPGTSLGEAKFLYLELLQFEDEVRESRGSAEKMAALREKYASYGEGIPLCRGNRASSL